MKNWVLKRRRSPKQSILKTNSQKQSSFSLGNKTWKIKNLAHRRLKLASQWCKLLEISFQSSNISLIVPTYCRFFLFPVILLTSDKFIKKITEIKTEVHENYLNFYSITQNQTESSNNKTKLCFDSMKP